MNLVDLGNAHFGSEKNSFIRRPIVYLYLLRTDSN